MIAHKATGARCYNYYNPSQGFIGASDNRSPAKAQRKKAEQGLLPDVSKWSQITFAVWKHLSAEIGVDLKAPRNILRLTINTAEVLSLVDHICRTSEAVRMTDCIQTGSRLSPPKWPGIRYDMDSEEGKLLLATPHGASVSWFLIEHKKVFGSKCVGAVSMFKEDGRLNILYEITDV